MSRIPPISEQGALFLDLDGTLIDIAPKPDDVVVPDDLPRLLNSVDRRLGGAMAIVSGRPLEDIDRLTAPHRFPCAAEHGALMRFADGRIDSAEEDYALPPRWREQLRLEARKWSGVVVEEKRYNVVLHYRQVPSARGALLDLARAIAAKAGRTFEVLPARMAFEIRHRMVNKGEAVRRFMSTLPFAGRTPIFVGDDRTDEDGFRAAVSFGGSGLNVNVAFGGKPANVREWLRAFAHSDGKRP